MASAKVYKADGSPGAEANLNDSIFDVEPNVGLVHQVAVALMNNTRQGNAETKVRKEVRGGGAKPLWRRDGGELFYLAPRGRMMAVPVQPGEAFAFGNAIELFSGDYYEESRGRTYDVTPNGERFIMVKYQRNFSDSDHGEIIAVLNWTNELSRLVPIE